MKADKYLYFLYFRGNLQLSTQEDWERSWSSWWKETSKRQEDQPA